MRSMNKLPLEKRSKSSHALRGVLHAFDFPSDGVSINTVTKLLVDAGLACAAFHDEAVRHVEAQRVQCDEIWCFTYAKARHV